MQPWIDILNQVGDTPENRENTLAVCLKECETDPEHFWSEDALVFFAHIRASDNRLWLACIAPEVQYWSKDDRTRFNTLLDEYAPHKEGEEEVSGESGSVELLAEITPEDVDWLWWPYFARGTVAMLDGDPGVGKSLFSLQLASAITQGWALPDQQGHLTCAMKTGNVVMLAAEDSARFTIRPRFDQAGGDASKVTLLNGIVDAKGESSPFTLQHMPVLLQVLKQTQPTLVIIDPIQAYLGKIDMHRANETRPLMTGLRLAAEAYNACIVCVRHPAKPGASTGKVLLRGLGSVDIIGAARTAVFVEQHPTERNKALIMQSKSNLGPHGRTLIFSKDEGRFEWCGVTRADAETLCGVNRGPDPLAMLECLFRLESMLNRIPQNSKDIEDRLAEEGHSRKIIMAARKKLGVKAKQRQGYWEIYLPDLEIISPSIHSEEVRKLESKKVGKLESGKFSTSDSSTIYKDTGSFGSRGDTGETGYSDSKIRGYEAESLGDPQSSHDPQYPVSRIHTRAHESKNVPEKEDLPNYWDTVDPNF